MRGVGGVGVQSGQRVAARVLRRRGHEGVGWETR